MQHPFGHAAGGAGFGPALRGYGSMLRAAQSIGLEWLDHARLSGEDVAAATGKLVAAPTPAAALAVQIDCLRAISERFAARATTCAGLLAALAADLAWQGRDAPTPGGGKARVP